MTLAEEFMRSDASRDSARKGFVWLGGSQGVVLVQAWAKKLNGSQRLKFPDDSVLILHADGSETADVVGE